LESLNRLDEALAVYDRLLQIDQNDTKALNRKGTKLARSGSGGGIEDVLNLDEFSRKSPDFKKAL
jgi:hypothetical protein